MFVANAGSASTGPPGRPSSTASRKLQDDYGGWASRNTSELFAEYVAMVGEALGDRSRNVG